MQLITKDKSKDTNLIGCGDMGSLQVIEQNNQRVLTTAQLAGAYETSVDYINRNFNNNRDRYKEGKHFILLEGLALKRFKMTTGKNDGSLLRVNRLYLWTEKGALLHAKSLNTDKAWEAYEMLVDDYFMKREAVKLLSEKEQLIASMKLTLQTSEEVASVKQELNSLKAIVNDQLTIDYGQQLAICNAKNKRVEKLWADGTYNIDFIDTKRKLHARAWREIKMAFAVPSYRDIKKQDFKEAISFIEGWRPSLI